MKKHKELVRVCILCGSDRVVIANGIAECQRCGQLGPVDQITKRIEK